MVSRIKEREEAIQLLAMDPQVCGKLPTLHQRANGVDVEALRDGIPSGKTPKKAPRWDLVDTESYAVELGFWLRLWSFGGTQVYIGGRSTSMEQQGAHEGGGRTPYLVPSLLIA